MPRPLNPSRRKKSLCALLRQVAQSYIAQTDDGLPACQRESVHLRNETDSLLTGYELGHIDPVESLRSAPLPGDFSPHEPAPLTGTNG